MTAEPADPPRSVPGLQDPAGAEDSEGAATDQDLGDELGFDNTAGLTEREYDIVRLIATGITNQEVGRALFVSVNTVKSYVRSAYRKMGVQTRSQAVVWAFDHGLVAPALTDVAARTRHLSVVASADVG